MMLWYDIYKELFAELLENFENEEISHADFVEQLDEFSQMAVEAVGEDTWRYWLKIRPDYVAYKRFNCNENQIVLF